jgi:hypothetical protein
MSGNPSSLDTEITTLTTDVSNDTSVEQSATTLINGFAARLQAAIDAATAAGATPAQLTSLDGLHTQLTQNASDLAAAVAANTPAPPNPTP